MLFVHLLMQDKLNKYKLLKWKNEQLVKEQIRQDTWCTNHINCFRCSLNTKIVSHNFKKLPESDAHIQAKFNKFIELRRKGFNCLVEARLKNGMRPDIIYFNEFEIGILEILESETDRQFQAKVKKYPFQTASYRIEK